MLGLLAALIVPGAVAVARQTGVVLLDAAYSIPIAFGCAVLSMLFARGASGRVEWTAGRAGGEGRVRAARLLALVGLCLALTAAVAVGVYEVLLYLE